MKLARDGWPTIAALLLMMAAGGYVSPWISVCLCVPLAFVCWFFRDPEREPERPLRDGDFLSPADGTIVEIEESEHEYTGKAVKIGTASTSTSTASRSRAPSVTRSTSPAKNGSR